jgi:hypothetical protein
MTGPSAFILVRSGKENPVCAKPAKAEGWHAVLLERFEVTGWPVAETSVRRLLFDKQDRVYLQ